ncbi:MAG: DUF3857 domain-containing protein [Bacteroidota bacterium]|nr:DUF3857 domain-containing protein [Bacteroidota bacterium]
MRVYLILGFLFISRIACAQATMPDFSNFSSEEINLKECSFDKNAEAVVLLDYAIADHDDEYRLITHRRIRIKIFHQREIDRGNIRIHFYSKDQFEYISNIKGLTYNWEGDHASLSYLDNKSIYTEKEDNHYSSIRFALPNVKPGSIIEYEYDSYMKHYGGLQDWVFQHDIPVIKSCYLLTVLPGTEFQYSVQKKLNYPIIIKPIQESGKIYFEMDNIPGLKFEPYMDAVKDYLQKVEFQLAQYTSHFGSQTKVNQTWKDLGYDLLSDRDFGGVIKKDLPKLDEVKSIVSAETTDSGKVIAIYNYVRNNFSWNGYYSTYAPDGLKNAWEKRSGTAGEINLILINLLQTFKIEVYPLLVAERDYGKVDTTYPFVDRFNKVAAYVRAGTKMFILDATKKFSPPGLIPFPLLNTIAFVVDKKYFRLIRILNNRDTYHNIITVNAKIDNNGLLKGTTAIESSAYAKEVRTEDIKTNTKKFIKEILEESANDPVVDNYSFDNLDDDSKPLVQKLEFHSELNTSGGFVFLIPDFFTALAKNPFTAEERFTNVNFGYPYDVDIEATIQLPEKSRIDKLPEDKDQAFGGKSVTISRKFRLENNTLTISMRFRQTITLVENEQYTSLKAIYQSVTDLMNGPIVIKISD